MRRLGNLGIRGASRSIRLRRDFKMSVQIGYRPVAANQQPPPNERTDVPQYGTQLVYPYLWWSD
jgi:hypothetical protein